MCAIHDYLHSCTLSSFSRRLNLGRGTSIPRAKGLAYCCGKRLSGKIENLKEILKPITANTDTAFLGLKMIFSLKTHVLREFLELFQAETQFLRLFCQISIF